MACLLLFSLEVSLLMLLFLALVPAAAVVLFAALDSSEDSEKMLYPPVMFEKERQRTVGRGVDARGRG